MLTAVAAGGLLALALGLVVARATEDPRPDLGGVVEVTAGPARGPGPAATARATPSPTASPRAAPSREARHPGGRPVPPPPPPYSGDDDDGEADDDDPE
ncbi:hypothetical protein D5H75_14780 [Bailinhaonella thermotolerans]|uniref:Uncharacterized protein n=1 Tax=Bailinhaonella thermotolerans TaxID=1070861 RepID=A0A3A4AVJ6_9ACTN|nr:hypothetical protein D5H75_14780 [Bailinhaonella thermotolerans]